MADIGYKIRNTLLSTLNTKPRSRHRWAQSEVLLMASSLPGVNGDASRAHLLSVFRPKVSRALAELEARLRYGCTQQPPGGNESTRQGALNDTGGKNKATFFLATLDRPFFSHRIISRGVAAGSAKAECEYIYERLYLGKDEETIICPVRRSPVMLTSVVIASSLNTALPLSARSELESP